MFKKEYLSSYIKWGIISAMGFCIPMILFIKAADYRSSWWLYVGNAVFLAAIAVYMLAFNKSHAENASTQTMVAAGHIATVIGIIVSCVVAGIVLALFGGGETMADAPAQTGTGDTHGLIFFVFMNATIGNLCGGSFSSLLIPYSARKNQTKDKKSEFVNN